MFGDELFDEPQPQAHEQPSLDEDFSQRLVAIERPGLHCADEPVARDKAHLQSQHAQQQITIGAGRHISAFRP
jgi:hypothetical protein